MHPGERISGRFCLEHIVGKGGMGVVYRAIDEVTGQTVAVKVIPVGDAEELERARRETAALAELTHPAIVRYIADGVTEDGSLFLAMEWVNGVTVAERLTSTGFSLRETMTMIGRIASALGAGHAAGILHRDVKPSNVLLPDGDPGRALLIDFGLARQAGQGSVTRTGMTIGTPGYMAPEQARGLRELSPAVDMFSLGCLLYECATGRPAFSGTLRAALLTKIMLAEPDAIHALCPEAPPQLCRLVDAMLAKDPRGRPADGATLAAAIAELGPIPDGPRRSNRSMVEAPTATDESLGEGLAHCLVLAAAGQPDEPFEGPRVQDIARLTEEVARWAAEPVTLTTGAVIIHLCDVPSAVVRRAAWCALATKRVFSGWTVVVSALESELAILAEASTNLLSTSALAVIFKKLAANGVVIDPSLAPRLVTDFELDMAGSPPRLIRSRHP